MTVAETMLIQRVEEAERATRAIERQLRKYLAGALCAECGEPLGEVSDGGEIIMDDERTIHARCE